MSIADKLTTIAENVPKVYEAGQKSEYDRFWDAYQANGDRTNYNYAFAGGGWTKETFKPKYDIKGDKLGGIFYQINLDGTIFSLIEALGSVKVDASETTSGQNLFYYAFVSDCPTLNLTSASNLNTCFSYSRIQYIEKLILKDDGSQTFTNTFISCTRLTDITIEGVIGNNFDIHWSTLLTHESIMSIINHLQTKTSGTFTLTLGSTNLAKLTDAEKAIATSRGWTLS